MGFDSNSEGKVPLSLLDYVTAIYKSHQPQRSPVFSSTNDVVYIRSLGAQLGYDVCLLGQTRWGVWESKYHCEEEVARL